MTAPGARPGSSSTPEEGRFAPGTVLAQRYRISGKLGQGGMGEVYRATDLLLGQTVALKFLAAHRAAGESTLERFRNEVRLARQVSHPNVCRVYDIGEIEGSPFLTMEYVDGEDLASLLRRIGRLPSDKAAETARRLCGGLAAAHEKGVLHRDLKPANVMIDGRGHVRITDFGLAGIAGTIRYAEIRAGTPAYMSPEQLAGKEVTEKSDLYALGLLLYEIFTGKRPFDANNLAELQRKQQAGPPSLTTLAKDVDPAVERVIARCLDPDPAKRPANALSVAVALPGGDPLAVALEAGETPSPEMVAAAGERAGISVRAAVACFVVVLVGLVLVAVLGGYTSVLRRTPFENSAEVLAQKARDLIQSLGYSEQPVDHASGWYCYYSYSQYAERKEKREEYQAQMAQGQPPPIFFWFRQSPRYLATLGIRHMVTAWLGEEMDPSLDVSGMVTVYLDPRGRLQYFAAVPPGLDERPSPQAAPDWTAMFRAAGIDPARFTPAEPQWIPLAPGFDGRAAWTGSYAHTPGIPIRIEAAAWRGKPVYFEVMGPWRRPWRMESFPQSRAASWVLVGLVCLLIATASLLAWRNLCLARGDTRGASRLAGFVFPCSLLYGLCSAHHVAAIEEVVIVLDKLGVALMEAGSAWALYMALEPYVRRRWPQSLIGWTRLLSDGIRDPLAGAQLLIGCAAGIISSLVFLGWDLVFVQYGLFHPFPGLGEALVGDTRRMAGLFFGALINAIGETLLMFFLFFLLRALLRRQWLAWAA